MEQRRPRSAFSVGALDQYLVYWLRFVAAHAAHALSSRLEKFGVTASEWVVLRELYRLGPSSPRLLAFELGMSQATLSRLVARLDLKYFVARSPVAHDKRRWQLQLTTVGRTLVPTLEELARENDAQFFGRLSGEEREQLTAVLKSLVQRHRLKPVTLD